MVHVSGQQFILTVFCSLLIFQQCVRLTGCQHERLLNGYLDILNFHPSFFFASHLSYGEGSYVLPRVFWTRTKLISIVHWTCVFGRKSYWAIWWPTILCIPHWHMGGQLAVRIITGDKFEWIPLFWWCISESGDTKFLENKKLLTGEVSKNGSLTKWVCGKEIISLRLNPSIHHLQSFFNWKFSVIPVDFSRVFLPFQSVGLKYLHQGDNGSVDKQCQSCWVNEWAFILPHFPISDNRRKSNKLFRRQQEQIN